MQSSDLDEEPTAREVEQPAGDKSAEKRRKASWPVLLLLLLVATAAVFYFVVFPPPSPKCHPSYPDICLDPDVADYDCNDIVERGFRVEQPDPYNLDADGDGRGCEGFPGQ